MVKHSTSRLSLLRRWRKLSIWIVIIVSLLIIAILNYEKYFVEGEQEISDLDDYTSHNTERLGMEGVKALLLKLDLIQDSSMLKVVTLVGIRPEFIKMSRVIAELDKQVGHILVH